MIMPYSLYFQQHGSSRGRYLQFVVGVRCILMVLGLAPGVVFLVVVVVYSIQVVAKGRENPVVKMGFCGGIFVVLPSRIQACL